MKDMEFISMIKEHARDKERLYTLMDLILNNSRLNYDKSKLTVDNDEVVMKYIQIIEPERYNDKFEFETDKYNNTISEEDTLKHIPTIE